MTKPSLLLLFGLLILRGSLFAQNPYESLGKVAPVLTLSEGKYEEFMTNDTVVQIGSVLFNTITNEVVSFVDEDSVRLMESDMMTRFLSVDPLGRKYPELTPYQFASNTPIQAIDLDGLEGVFFGSLKQYSAIPTLFASDKKITNLNYTPYQLTNLHNAVDKLKDYNKAHYEDKIQIQVVYLTSHGNDGNIYLNPGPDGKITTDAVPEGAHTFTTDDEPIGSVDIETYLGQNKGLPGWPASKAGSREFVNDLKEVMGQIQDGGTLILGSCNSGRGEEGNNLIKKLYELSGNRINIVLNQDYTTEVRNNKGADNGVLNSGRTTNLESGWKIIGPSTNGKVEDTGKNLKLDGLNRDKLYKFENDND